MSNSDAEYKLYFWGGVPGRAEPIRLALQEAGIEYEDIENFFHLLTRGAPRDGSAGATHFAPPILEHGDLIISQLPNIMAYIGPKTGLVPKDEVGIMGVQQYFLTLADLQNEAVQSHHPIDFMLSFEDQKDAAIARTKIFREKRVPVYFDHFEASLKGNKESNGDWLVGQEMTYADLMLFHVVEGLQHALPRYMLKTLPKYPMIENLFERVKSRPNIAAYLASDRRRSFSAGPGTYQRHEALDEQGA